MAEPIYFPGFTDLSLEPLLIEVPWLRETETRQECFMSDPIQTYTYGQGRGIRKYTSILFQPVVRDQMARTNAFLAAEFEASWGFLNGCFLNRYDNAHQHLGWHADDFDRMDQDHPIAVISVGEPREIWWRTFGHKGEIPDNQKQLLGHNSLFVMPPGFQLTHQHRIPKGGREMSPRVSLTFRRFL